MFVDCINGGINFDKRPEHWAGLHITRQALRSRDIVTKFPHRKGPNWQDTCMWGVGVDHRLRGLCVKGISKKDRNLRRGGNV